MDFRTALTVPKASWSFGTANPVLTMGSCFATAIGDRLVTRKFNACTNPFGTTYHPLAIHRLIRLAIHNQPPDPDAYVKNQGTWYHYDFHSSLCATSREALGMLLAERINEVHEFLRHAGVICLTYGTAWIFELATGKRPVANCQKMPSGMFARRLVSTEEIVADFRNSVQTLHSFNPEARIIVTVSPVRHVKDTLPLNQVSKSTLRLACHQLQETEPTIDYFPAYELMVDDLRDYRFYADDLIHPTPFAEEYIWQKFGEAYFSAATRLFLKQWEPLRLALMHRPMQPQGEAYRAFLNSTLQQLKQLETIIDVQKEIAAIEEQLLHAESR